MSSEQVPAVDAAWLHMDRPSNSMVIDAVLQCEGRLDQRRLEHALDERVIARFRRFRQRISDPTLNLSPWTSPYWIDVAHVRAREHIQRATLAAPGDEASLRRLLGQLCSRPLRPDRPLWEVHLIDVDDGGPGEGEGPGSLVLLRLHHAMGDGIALIQVLLSLTDPVDGCPDPRLLPIRDETGLSPLLPGVAGRAVHQVRELTRHASARTVAVSGAMTAALAHPERLADLSAYPRSQAATLAKLGFGLHPQRNRLQGPLTGDKHRGWTTDVALATVKTAGRRAGATVNDLMMAAISGALRGYLSAQQDVVPDLVVIMPVNLRPPGDAIPSGLGNCFGLVFVPLPTAETDRARRLTRTKATLDQVKAGDEATFVHTMLELMGHVPKPAQTTWVDAFAARATAIVTNISGPQHAVSLAGTPVRDLLAFVPATGPLGLGISICSYAGRLRLAVAADAALVPDLPHLLTLLEQEVGAVLTTG